MHGHRAARIDPLDLLQREDVGALDPKRYGLVDSSKSYDVNGILWTKRVGEAPETPEHWTLRDITNHLHSVYVGRIAYEYMHSSSKTERLWFSHILEARTPPLLDSRQKKRIHELLAHSETFDQFLQLKFPNLKRYGLEGGESMIPALDALFSVAARGSKHFIFQHRSSLLIQIFFCNSRCGSYRACYASQRPSELVDGLVTATTRFAFPQDQGRLRDP